MSTSVGRRLGLGPVFAYEWITSSRRWQGYALRSSFVLSLLLALLVVWKTTSPRGGENELRFMARLGEFFFLGVIGTQLTLVLLAAPAATAGAICLDRARGTLTHILVTDLSNAEIVLGKLAARLVPVMGLVAFTLPVMALLILLGGVDPDALLRAFVVTLGVAVLGCSLAMVLSLWVGRTHEALLGTYAVCCLWLLARPMISSLASTIGWPWAVVPRGVDPFFLAFAPYWWPNSVGWTDYLWFLLATCSISALLVLVAVLRLRAVCTRETVRKTRRRPSATHGGNMWRLLHRTIPWLSPSLDGNPVLWREWHRSRPSRLTIGVTTLYVGLSVLFSILAIFWSAGGGGAFVNGFQVLVGLLLLSVTAATSLAEERVRGSLDVLLSTPLSGRQIVLGKWLGSYRIVPLLAILPWFLVACVAFVSGSPWWASLLMIAYVLCAGAAVTSLGLAVATWCSRLGRAVGITVTLYVLVSVGWIFFAMMVYGPGRQGEKLAMASPFFWAGEMTWEFGTLGAPAMKVDWAIFWIVVSALVGAEFLYRTLGNFERRLGRIEDVATRLGRPSRRIRLITAIYVSSSIVFGLFALEAELVPVICAVQFAVGTLLLAGSASSSLSEDRGSGGSDIMAVCRLSAARIVLVRWARASRLISPVVLLPLLTIFCSTGPKLQFGPAPFVLIFFMLANGASAVSLGVAMAVWCRRGAWAVVLTMLIWVFVNMGGAALAIALPGVPILRGSSVSDPFVGMAMLTGEVIGASRTSGLLAWAVGWSIAYALVAAVLVGATLATLAHAAKGRAEIRLPFFGPLGRNDSERKGALFP